MRKRTDQSALLTVSPRAISSSGTRCGLKTAGVIQAQRVLSGNNVTITSPFSERGTSHKKGE